MNFSMYSAKADEAVGEMVREVVSQMYLGRVYTRKAAIHLLNTYIARLREQYPDLYDIEPQEHIVDELNTTFEHLGFIPLTLEDLT